jgi:hypothetical protein
MLGEHASGACENRFASCLAFAPMAFLNAHAVRVLNELIFIF